MIRRVEKAKNEVEDLVVVGGGTGRDEESVFEVSRYSLTRLVATVRL